MTPREVHSTARRTTIRSGRELDYDRIHAEVPAAVLAALHEAGVLRWQIWRDGCRLFHVIDTRDGYAHMEAAIAAAGPVDPQWDAVIAALLESEPAADRLLPLVWTMVAGEQQPADRGARFASSEGTPNT